MNVTIEMHDSAFGSEILVSRGEKESVCVRLRWDVFTSGYVYFYEVIKDIQQAVGTFKTDNRAGSFTINLAGISLEEALSLLKREMKSLTWDRLQKEKQNYLDIISQIEQQELIY